MLWNADGEKLAIGVREPDGYKGKVQTTQWGTWPTFESWNWPGHEGKDITVEVYSRYPEVALYLDGKFIGKKPPEAMMASFTLPRHQGQRALLRQHPENMARPRNGRGPQHRQARLRHNHRSHPFAVENPGNQMLTAPVARRHRETAEHTAINRYNRHSTGVNSISVPAELLWHISLRAFTKKTLPTR